MNTPIELVACLYSPTWPRRITKILVRRYYYINTQIIEFCGMWTETGCIIEQFYYSHSTTYWFEQHNVLSSMEVFIYIIIRKLATSIVNVECLKGLCKGVPELGFSEV